MGDDNQKKDVVVIAGPFHSEAYYQKDVMYQDIADMYSNVQMERYYIVTPWKYIIKRYVKFAFIFLIFSIFSFNLFLVPLIPLSVMVWLQYYNFAKYSANMNVSSKKLLVSMGVVTTLEMIFCAYIRYILFGIIFV